MTIQRSIVLFISAAILAACSGGGSPPVPNVHDVPAAPVVPGSGTLNVGPYIGHFTEYALPSGQTGPGDLTVGPDGAIWFTVNKAAIDRITGTGSIATFNPPPLTVALFSGIASSHDALWYGGILAPPNAETEPHLFRQDSSGAADVGFLGPDTFDMQIIVGPDHLLWFYQTGLFISSVGRFSPVTPSNSISVDLPGPFIFDAAGIAAGPDGNIYVTAFGDSQPIAAVFQISTGGKILNQFNLPDGSDPKGIIAGPDGALWIALRGSNSIGRLTPTGTLTQFPLPHANAIPFEITKGSDGALWFTEQGANAIGRITTSGSITEYPVPTPNAKLFGITSCPQQCENAHGRLWFTEQNANKVGKFEF